MRKFAAGAVVVGDADGDIEDVFMMLNLLLPLLSRLYCFLVTDR
jgi:hypothetical protein